LLPSCFELEPTREKVLFSILAFQLKRPRPLWLPEIFSLPIPDFSQSNWRFYGKIKSAEGPKPGVCFIRTVTNSMALAFFGRALARSFPLVRSEEFKMAS